MKKYLLNNLYARLLNFTVVIITLFGVSVQAQSTLCDARAKNQDFEWVSRIKINDGTRTSEKTGYADFTYSPISTLIAGQTYEVEVDVNTSNNNSGDWTENIKLWFDLNQDSIIDVQELLFKGNAIVRGLFTFKGTITLPKTTFNGDVIGRMIMQYEENPVPCGDSSHGTVYDIKVNVRGGMNNPHKNILTVSKTGKGEGSITSSPAGIDTANGIYSFDFKEKTTVELTAKPKSGSTFSNWSDDALGNDLQILVEDIGGKNIIADFGIVCPSLSITDVADVTVNCGASLLPANTGMATAKDNCSNPTSSILVTYKDTKVRTVCGEKFTRTWTATASGNTISSKQLITINAAALPSMTAPSAITVSLSCGSLPAPSKLQYTNGLSGSCLLSGSSFDSTFDLVADTNGETYKETWTANDDCERAIASVSRTITVLQNKGGLESLESLVFFSSKGAIGNTGISTITGNIGTSVGAITGFGLPTELNGTISLSNSVTIKAKKDLQSLYIQLSNVPVTVMDHAPVFGKGETLTAGVYSIAAAGSLVGNITLDGQNNPNSLFLLKYNGAFSVAATSKVILKNGQKASNVFWMAEGAISVGALSTMKGILFAHTGAVSLGAGCDLEGRMYSTTGAVTMDSGNAYLPTGNSLIPIIPINRSAYGEDLLGSVANFVMYSGAGAISNTGASGFIGDVGSNLGAITGFETSATSLINNVYHANAVTAKAKIDLDYAYQTLASMSGKPIAATLAGLTLTPGVYTVAAAGTLTGNVTLDAQGDANAVFVIKFGGAFSTEAQSRVHLINGASYSNVFWVAEGAISMGALSFMKGTLIAHNAAVSMGARGNLEGRMLSNVGAISFSTGVAYIEYLNCMASSVANRSKSSASKLVDTPVKLEATTLMAYPNPFTSSTTVRFTTPYTESNASLVLYDIRGAMIQVLYTGNTAANQKKEVKFNRQHLSPGVYFFRLTTSKEGKNVRVIIK